MQPREIELASDPGELPPQFSKVRGYSVEAGFDLEDISSPTDIPNEALATVVEPGLYRAVLGKKGADPLIKYKVYLIKDGHWVTQSVSEDDAKKIAIFLPKFPITAVIGHLRYVDARFVLLKHVSRHEPSQKA